MALKIVDSTREIKVGMYNAIAREINPDMSKKTTAIETAVKIEIRKALVESPAIQSLNSGLLKADFGLTSDPTGAIIESIVDSTRVTYKPIQNSNSGGVFQVTVQPISYSNLYSLGVSQQAIEGGSLPWLKWLLEAGDTILIVDFGVEYGDFGRTGQARMTGKNRPFKVNSSFSGVSNDNFITRAIASRRKEINNAIMRVIV
jgi:hypothetical protein